jgi:hypothetical protein
LETSRIVFAAPDVIVEERKRDLLGLRDIGSFHAFIENVLDAAIAYRL